MAPTSASMAIISSMPIMPILVSIMTAISIIIAGVVMIIVQSNTQAIVTITHMTAKAIRIIWIVGTAGDTDDEHD